MKSVFLTVTGAVGSFIAAALGGWDAAVITLIVFMCIDFITGWIVAVVFKKSHKTESGGYSSAIGVKGLCKKFMVFLLVVVANRLDKQIGASYVRDFVCIAYIFNEGMSIIENAALMGVPIPKPLKKALDVLHDKVEGGSDEQ
jgi:toxin secretion/phage lysis holin